MEYYDIDDIGTCMALIMESLQECADHGVVMSFELTYIDNDANAAPLFRLSVYEKTRVSRRVYQGKRVVLYSSSDAKDVLMFLQRHLQEIKSLRTNYEGAM